MAEGAAVAAAALALVGAPFRLHGREPASGLDCIGVIVAALRAAGWAGAVPSGYALRGGDPATVIARFDAVLARGGGDAAGDVLLFRVGPGQLHGAVRAGRGIVHADAGLRRVVERPGAADWPLLGAWRYEGRG
ncbi:peptidoglycan endopeptidase [Sphingomonas melonis]|uniref:Cell wall-associated NlpC family hydrolase n=1 Tax=Sphingomonas melonis TaxID=152682 RepID=A0A7Y9FSQ5_9SPHN|nr:cell wall-associated NlpC family hydrolase [Sphingomonas melonis]